eukprot:GEMP01020369.1.p1 GENE.GEMP01020369.1~~GEMP01020369.1.p1  ORF type:complete len:692 (+),score=170.34 GEMP01020369.1:138-2213(+)
MTYKLSGPQSVATTSPVLIAAKFAKLAVQPIPEGKNETLKLRLPNGDAIERKDAILKYLGRAAPSGLCGDSPVEDAQIDSWLEWNSTNLDTTDPEMVRKLVDTVLEPHLKSRTFLVTERVSVADIAVSCSLVQKVKAVDQSKTPATFRWFNTCLNHALFQEVLDTGSCPKVATPSVPVISATPAAASSTVISGPAKRSVLADAPYSSTVGGRKRIAGILEAHDGGASLKGEKIAVCGWVKTITWHEKNTLVILQLNDGSGHGNMQVVIKDKATGFAYLKKVHTGASLRCVGMLVESTGKNQAVEILIEEPGTEVKLLGTVADPANYPLSKKQHSLEFLREVAHLRPRSYLIGCVSRIRNALAKATHDFFQSRGFLYVHTPLITAADCEGAGELFQVTTMLQQAKDQASQLPVGKDGKLDYTKDFFAKPAYLTVSGQLSVETYCCALSDVYTFGPTFRAENSHTSRHLSEFWMIEPELAFADIHDCMTCAEDYLKFCIQAVYDNHQSDLAFFEERIEKGLINRLKNLLHDPFQRLTYTEAIEVLQKEEKKVKFEVKVEWGMDLGSEHERYLAEKVYKKPVIVYNYPSNIKAFYMRRNEDGKTCAAMDILCPNVGELVGGSQREERMEVLDKVIVDLGLKPEDYWWYRDLRQYGTIPHAGFGLGFERLVMFCTGVENIRDSIPFPRYPGHAEF